MLRVLISVLLACLTNLAGAQDWPNRPVRVLVGFSPGGTTDLSARLVADYATKALGQTFVVENRPGASGVIAIELALRAPADGYTIVVGSDSSFYQPLLNPRLKYRAERDFAPVTIFVNQPILIAAHPAPGWRSIKDVLAAARSHPGDVTYAVSSPTGTQAVAGALFFKMAGVKVQSVAYKGGGQAVIDVVGGQVPLAVLGVTPLIPQIRAGKLRALAVTSGKRSPHLPDVPALAEAGFPDMDITQWFGAAVHKDVPAAVIARMSEVFQKALGDRTLRDRLAAVALEPVGGTPQLMASRMRAESVLWTRVAKEAGLGRGR